MGTLGAMVFGVGIDCIEVARIAARIGGEEGLVEKVFTAGERAYCAARHDPAQHFAARFAAKEALFKALGTGWGGGMRWQEVEVVNEENGRPRLELRGQVAAFATEQGITRVHVSLTHVKELACAVVVLET
ncbi:MAG: holo-ACP synthase [bacterium]|nr:holo-ACP synthase [bacterium]